MLLFLISCQTNIEPDAISSTLSVSGRVVTLFGGEGLDNVAVCLDDDSDICTETSGNGDYTLSGLATEGSHTVFMDAPGLVAGAVSFDVSEGDVTLANVSLLSEQLIAGQFSALDIVQQPDTGILAFSISNGINGDGVNIPQIGLSLEPSAGEGPFYNNVVGIPSAELESTSDNGGGVLVNIPPALYTLNYTGLPDDCGLLLGQGSVEAHGVPMYADRVSFARIECDVQQ